MSGLHFRFAIECTNFVAVEISNIGITYVTALFAWAGGAFIGSPALQTNCVKLFKGLHGRGNKCDHCTVTGRRWALIEWRGDVEFNCVFRGLRGVGCVGFRAFNLHQTKWDKYGIVKPCRPIQVIGTDHYITYHFIAPLSFAHQSSLAGFIVGVVPNI